MAVPSIAYQQYLDSNGLPRNGGLVYTYAAGTLTPKATYTSAAATTQAQNPVVLNSSGIPDHGSGNIGMIWIQGSYDFLVTNSDGTDPIWIMNETSFNTVSAAGASYFQSFSGDDTTTTFTLSEPLGTDENAVLFFVDNGISSFITNGDFATDTIWTKGAGWTIAAGVATATGAISTDISQTANATINQGQSYNVTYTITRSAGTITPNVGGATGVARSASGTYTETIIAGSTQNLAFNTAGFTGTLDTVSVKLVEGIGWQVVPPTQFTLNNTSITFATAPKTGTNNIIGFAFSTLVAAASASAAAAEAFANAANVSAVNAAASASSLLGTSTTSVLIAVGTKNFTTQTGKNFTTGEFITVSSNAGPTNYMFGQVISYATLTGALSVNVTDTGGSGTFADWNIAVSGIKGPAGTVTPSNNSITYPMLTSGIVASTANIVAGTASVLVNAANLKAAFPGMVIDTAYNENTANTTLSTVIPLDNTIPQIGEGVQILSASITPKSTTTKLRIIAHATYGNDASSSRGIMAAFVNGGTNAVAAAAGTYIQTANQGGETTLMYEYTPGSTSAQAITIRLGPNTSSIYLNSNSTGQILGGVSRATLLIQEIQG
jgi:hypothetical protein